VIGIIMAKKPRTDRYGNSLPPGVYERGDKYYVLMCVNGVFGQHGSFTTIAEAQARVADLKYGSGPIEAPPALAAPIEPIEPIEPTIEPIEPNKELILLQIRNAIASKEAYIAIANMETRAGIEWTAEWNEGWIKSGKEVKRLIALFYGDKK
jgi:hypothetical protein